MDKEADKGQIFTEDAAKSRGEPSPTKKMPDSRETVRERRNEAGV